MLSLSLAEVKYSTRQSESFFSSLELYLCFWGKHTRGKKKNKNDFSRTLVIHEGLLR